MTLQTDPTETQSWAFDYFSVKVLTHHQPPLVLTMNYMRTGGVETDCSSAFFYQCNVEWTLSENE